MLFPLIVLCILSLVFILSLIGLARRLPVEKEFTKIIGHTNDSRVQKIIKKLEAKSTKTAQDHYMLATLYRHNSGEAQEEKVQVHYQKAAELIATAPVGRVANMATEIFEPRAVLRRAEDYFTDREVNEQRVLWATIHQAESNLTRADNFVKEEAKKQLGAVGGTEKYFEEKKHWTNDPQNVHDSGVNRDMLQKFVAMKDEHGKVDIRAFQEEVMKHIEKLPAEKRQRAANVFDTIRRNSYIDLSAIGAPEIELWAHVWKRGDKNEDIRESVLSSMADCEENGHIVCTTGRAARAISSLTLLDNNPTLAIPPKTYEMIRNEVFEKSAHIFKESLLARGDNFAIEYNSGNIPEGDATSFENSVKEKIAEHVKDTYDSSLTDTQIQKIIVEAQAGID
nr:hypothetical protein K-LCC10_0412 [Kaumoebavirus]